LILSFSGRPSSSRRRNLPAIVLHLSVKADLLHAVCPNLDPCVVDKILLWHSTVVPGSFNILMPSLSGSPNPLLFFPNHASLNSRPQLTPSPSSGKPTRRPTLRRRKPTAHRWTPRHPRPPHRRRWKPLEIWRHTARRWKRHRRTSILRRA